MDKNNVDSSSKNKLIFILFKFVNESINFDKGYPSKSNSYLELLPNKRAIIKCI